MINTLVFVAAFCIVAVLVYMARYSGRVRVTYHRIIDASIADVYAKVEDLGQWKAWCPWLEDVPAGVLVLTGEGRSKGARCAWVDAKMGEGALTHQRLLRGQEIAQRLRLKHPFTVRGSSHWTFVEVDGRTEVTWSVAGRVAFAMRIFASTVNGALAFDLRYGLDRLAALLEPQGAPRYTITHEGSREVSPCRYVYKTYSGPIKALSLALPSLLGELRRQLVSRNVQPCGAPIAVYLKTNIKLRTTVCQVGLPVADADVGEMPVREMPAHRASVVTLRGRYIALEVAWYQAMQRLTQESIRPDQRLPPFERYHGGLGEAQEDNCVTELHIPLIGT